MTMKNVTVRDAHGNEIAFYPSLSNNMKLVHAELADKFGPGKYKLCFKAPGKTVKVEGKNGSMVKKKTKDHPTTRIVWVADGVGNPVPLSVPANMPRPFSANGGGYNGQMVLMEKLTEMAGHTSDILRRLDSLEATEDDDDEEEEDDEEENDEEGGLAKAFGGLIAEPKYASIFSGVLTGNPEVIKTTILKAIDEEPEVFTELIGKCVTIILTHV
jgi:hypothetical protein